jgi:hypothetical protein
MNSADSLVGLYLSERGHARFLAPSWNSAIRMGEEISGRSGEI